MTELQYKILKKVLMPSYMSKEQAEQSWNEFIRNWTEPEDFQETFERICKEYEKPMAIVQAHTQGVTYRALGEQYGCSGSNIQAIDHKMLRKLRLPSIFRRLQYGDTRYTQMQEEKRLEQERKQKEWEEANPVPTRKAIDTLQSTACFWVCRAYGKDITIGELLKMGYDRVGAAIGVSGMRKFINELKDLGVDMSEWEKQLPPVKHKTAER